MVASEILLYRGERFQQKTEETLRAIVKRDITRARRIDSLGQRVWRLEREQDWFRATSSHHNEGMEKLSCSVDARFEVLDEELKARDAFTMKQLDTASKLNDTLRERVADLEGEVTSLRGKVTHIVSYLCSLGLS